LIHSVEDRMRPKVQQGSSKRFDPCQGIADRAANPPRRSLQTPRRAMPEAAAHHQAEIETRRMDQHPLGDVLPAPQVSPPHTVRVGLSVPSPRAIRAPCGDSSPSPGLSVKYVVDAKSRPEGSYGAWHGSLLGPPGDSREPGRGAATPARRLGRRRADRVVDRDRSSC
jgi:hypothetical protein